MTGSFQIKELAQVLGGVVLIRGALINGEHAGLTVFRLVACLQAECVDLVI